MTKLGDALFSSAQQPILACLFGRPEQWFHVQELIRLTNLGSATVQRELNRLEKGGLIETRRIANLKQVRACEHNPIFDELRLIVIKTFGVVEVLREALAQLASNIKLAFVYGSVAQGSDRASSDIDFMLISETLSYGQIMAALGSAEKQLGRAVQITQYTLEEFLDRKRSNHPFLAEVLRQPKLMVIGTEDDIDNVG
ncbi:nucleotidyltransferase-like protein [Trinickia symbiotica]|uniref:Transcriptional regulator n=1 Tax=Trinickia symbiotica TaxID=863227 RepID=A0A2N7X3I8_9BURK|nr:nucleotidyltransferase domain-containing protein [Trinickia symbiotica]PMS36045.1 transcriptional regulator [Trinickia symbiotica]PPK45719.1 nucleotidyltransferase-like protein [Trinickia symbiotica]